MTAGPPERGPSAWVAGDGDLRPEDHSFALCLTHDVDRPYLTYQSVYYGVLERSPGRLLDPVLGRNPYWQFDRIRQMESELGVRSAFYFLDEQRLFRDRPVWDWLRPEGWMLFAGRYDVDEPAIAELIRELDDGGWEVGLHGSYHSYRDQSLLREEKRALEAVLGHPVLGGRQHYLNFDPACTWHNQSRVGLRYDSTIGSSTEYGFHNGYRPIRLFDDEFVVFPLTLMDQALPAVRTEPGRAWEECEALLEEAADNDAVMTVLWHPRRFSERYFPNYARLYRRLVERALEMGAWVGPPREYYYSMPGTPARSELEAATSPGDREPQPGVTDG